MAVGCLYFGPAASLPLTMPRTQSSQEGADGATPCGIQLIFVGLVDMLVYFKPIWSKFGQCGGGDSTGSMVTSCGAAGHQ